MASIVEDVKELLNKICSDFGRYANSSGTNCVQRLKIIDNPTTAIFF